MADAKKCDRCGNFYIEKDKQSEINGLRVDYIKLYRSDGYCIKKYDLCDDCVTALLEFMKKRKSLEEITRDYIVSSNVVMSEYLRTCGHLLTVEDKRELLKIAGEDDLMEVLDNGEIVERQGEKG